MIIPPLPPSLDPTLSDDLSGICAVGFEPNPKHAAKLKEIERAYSACSWKTRFFTETAVSDYTGTTELFPDTKSDPKFKVPFW